MYTLEPLTPQNQDGWNALIQQCPHSVAFQGLAWRDALANSFRQLDPMYLLIKQGDAIIGGLPAFVFQPIPGIRLWHSMPWNLFGGPHLIASGHADTAGLMATLETYLQTKAAENGWCELRWTLSPQNSIRYGNIFTAAGYKQTTHFTHLLETHGDVNSLWHAYNKRVRGAVRKAEKSGVVVTDTTDIAAVSTFYNMYLTTVKRLGGTPKPRTLMDILLQRNVAKLAVATYQDTIIAGLLYLHFNRTVTLWCEASVPEFLQYRPNNAIFHHIITWACQAGYAWVDFGASPPESSGLIAHKEQYRAERTDFCSYTKVMSPMKRGLWVKSESMLRKVYTWMQNSRLDVFDNRVKFSEF